MKKILVVDDDKKMRELLSDILSSHPDQFQVTQAEDGDLALELLRKESFDLLITDRAMQRMGGLDLLRQLREEKREITTIMISAYGEEKMWAEAIGLGASDYILKPFKNEDVLRVVEKQLRPPKGKKK